LSGLWWNPSESGWGPSTSRSVPTSCSPRGTLYEQRGPIPSGTWAPHCARCRPPAASGGCNRDALRGERPPRFFWRALQIPAAGHATPRRHAAAPPSPSADAGIDEAYFGKPGQFAHRADRSPSLSRSGTFASPPVKLHRTSGGNAENESGWGPRDDATSTGHRVPRPWYVYDAGRQARVVRLRPICDMNRAQSSCAGKLYRTNRPPPSGRASTRRQGWHGDRGRHPWGVTFTDPDNGGR